MTTEAEAYEAAGRVYAAILADPDRRAALLAHRRAAQTSAPAVATPEPRRERATTSPRRKSA